MTSSINKELNITVPKIIFIIPYRERKQQKHFFTKYMDYIMEDYNKDDYEIYFSHQCDNRPFNRGGMKNIGFIAMKNKYPNDYKKITFVFNDIDTIPYKKNLLPYQTQKGILKHFFGFEFALGGIFSITGEDFENINGFPNMWGWSMEDNILNKRAMENNLFIDRSIFFKIGDHNILHMMDGVNKIINKKEIVGFLNNNYNFGLNSLSTINYNIENEYININYFESETKSDKQFYERHNLLEPNASKIRISHRERNANRNIIVNQRQNQRQNHNSNNNMNRKTLNKMVRFL